MTRLLMAVLLFVLAASGFAQTPVRGGVAVIAVAADPTTLNPGHLDGRPCARRR